MRSNVKKDPDWHDVVALALRSAPTPVTHGENAGETLDEAAIARVLSDAQGAICCAVQHSAAVVQD
jgi:hypothetical protein